MNSLVQDDMVRAATFFSLAFVLTAVGGFLTGEFRTGIEWGLGLGVAFAVFAYFFIKPTADDEVTHEQSTETPTEESPPESSESSAPEK